ncbi:hypothetical protein ACFL29_01380 [Patescibacteria group bacterium]
METLLVRIYLGTKFERIPLGFPRKHQRSKKEKEEKQKNEALLFGHATHKGKQVLEVECLHAPEFLDQLESAGLILTEAGWCREPHPQKQNKFKHFIELVFSKTGEKVSLNDPSVAGLKKLTENTWNNCDGFENPSGVHVVNLRGFSQATPHYRVMVEGQSIIAPPL